MSVSFERLFGLKGAGISLVNVVVADPDGSCDSGLATIDGLELGVARVAHSLRDALFEESRRRIGDAVELVEESTADLAVSARDFDSLRRKRTPLLSFQKRSTSAIFRSSARCSTCHSRRGMFGARGSLLGQPSPTG